MVEILVVDDRPDGLLAMEAVLASPEYELIKASSGHEALASLYYHDFAAILLDVQMPVMDGFETAKLIRQYLPARETPIVFITAINKDSHHISRGYESGAIDYLFKPIDPEILKSKVKILVELYQSRQILKRMNEELEARVVQRTSELMEVNKELEQFVYIASHDLQEPLRKIIIFSERLKENLGEKTDAASMDCLERMHKAGIRMKTVIEDLLFFSKTSAKELTFERVDLQEVIQNILSDLEIMIAQRHVTIEVRELPAVMASKSQIHHLFQNLILNAIKFSKKDQDPHIVIDNETTPQYLNIYVRDNGIGFDEKYADNIFKLFHRLHPQSEYGGNGIGLSICKKIVEQHRGKIRAHSKPGQGSTFVVSLPLPVESFSNNEEISGRLAR